MTRDEAFLQYEEALAKINEQAQKETNRARDTLRAQLKILQNNHHKELKAIRVITQKTRVSNKH